MLTARAVVSKKKSVEIVQAFIAGAPKSAEGDVFYGVTDSNQGAWQAKASTWYYIDNAYFDVCRGTHFRVSRNRLQHSGNGLSDCARFDGLRVAIKPWRKKGEHVVVCPQSDDFMRRMAEYKGNWLFDVRQQLLLETDRPFRIREWSSDKIALASTLHDDLENAWATLTWSSAAAIESIIAGVPAVVQGPCAAYPVSIQLSELEQDIHNVIMADRWNWAGVLADNQFTLDEMRSGLAWHTLNP